MSTKNSLIVALVMLVAFGSVALWVRQGLRFSVAAPSQKLSGFPKTVDGWQGTEEVLEEGVTKILSADDVLSLRFAKAGELPVVVHASTWVDPDSVRNGCPHHPDVCYQAHGWTILEREDLDVEVDRLGKVPVQAIVMRRGNEQVIVAFNYRLADKVYTNEKTAHAMHLQFFGKSVWPAVTKLMIQVPSPNIEAAKPNIERFVRAFYRWYLP